MLEKIKNGLRIIAAKDINESEMVQNQEVVFHVFDKSNVGIFETWVKCVWLEKGTKIQIDSIKPKMSENATPEEKLLKLIFEEKPIYYEVERTGFYEVLDCDNSRKEVFPHNHKQLRDWDYMIVLPKVLSE